VSLWNNHWNWQTLPKQVGLVATTCCFPIGSDPWESAQAQAMSIARSKETGNFKVHINLNVFLCYLRKWLLANISTSNRLVTERIKSIEQSYPGTKGK
jgi:hypothetical protein